MSLYTTRAKCHNCLTRGDCILVPRKVGGSYNRAAAFRPCNLCTECLPDLCARITPGTMTTSRWSNTRLRQAATDLGTQL